jgi:hypothetical protein
MDRLYPNDSLPAGKAPDPTPLPDFWYIHTAVNHATN